ncbi:hypothetical protein K4F52_004131 [Lecanicillium sp. MT-2017a]|nr:hypothetical protein K4F52_004131 [Lecanicillium sp. MT-2017a]
MVAIQASHCLASDSSPRKRRASSTPAAVTDDEGFPHKKKKIIHPPPKFWDNLSKVPLTRSALEELNSRNNKAPYNSSRIRNVRRSRRLDLAPNTHSETANHILSRYSPLTRKRVKRFASHGGPDLFDLRGCPTPRVSMSSRNSSLGRRKRGSRSPQKKSAQSPEKSSTTTSTRSTGPYDRACLQHLIDHNILQDEYEYPDGTVPPPPANRDEILDALAVPRGSLSPSKFSNDQFRKFKRADTHASKEREVTVTVMPIIEGDVGDGRCRAGEIPFTNLDDLTDGTLVPGNPDIYYGARPEQLDRNIRRELDGKIIPSTQHDLPIAPNFFVQVKGPDGSLAVANRQATYDAALGARGYLSLQSYGQTEPTYDNKAYTLTSIYHGGQLKVYSSHPIAPAKSGDAPGYVMTQLKAYALTSDADSFRIGATAHRNGRDWAKRQRDNVINQANMRAATKPIMIDPLRDPLGLNSRDEVSIDATITTSQETALQLCSNARSSDESDTSEDELLHHSSRPVKRSRSPEKKKL